MAGQKVMVFGNMKMKEQKMLRQPEYNSKTRKSEHQLQRN